MRFSRLLAGLGSVLFALPVIASWQSGGVPSILQVLAAAMLLLTVVRPTWGLLALAFFLPLTPYLAAVTQAGIGRSAVGEVVLAPFLLGTTLRILAVSRWPPARLAAPALVFGSVVAVDCVLGLAARQQATTWPLDFVQNLWHHLSTGYFEEPGTFMRFHEAVVWLEGLALAVIAESLLRMDRRAWPAVLLAGGSAVAVTSWVRLFEISLRREQPLKAAIEFLQTQRIQTLFTDANAAASLYVLYFVPAAWMVLQAARASTGPTRWRARAAYGLAAILLGLALYMPHSRAAYAGAIVALAGLWLASRRIPRVALASGLGLASLLLVVFVLLNPGSRTQVSSGHSMGIRWEMGRIALQITTQQPVFGIGLGQFRQASRAFVTPELQALFPATAVGENAHNNFLQILAELGLVGLGAFLWILGVVALSATRARRDGPVSTAPLGLAGGLLAFLVSCLAGHPFLTPEVLWVFCLALGVTIGLEPVRDRPASAESMPRLALSLTLVLVALTPVRLWQLYRADVKHSVIGAGPLTQEGSEIPYRHVGPRSALFPPSSTRIAVLPLRLTAESPASCLVRFYVDGHQANLVEVTPDSWSPLAVLLNPSEAISASRRLELRVDDSACRLMVGSPTYRE